MDADRYWNEVESELRRWIDSEFTLATESVLVISPYGLESKKGPTARGEAHRKLNEIYPEKCPDLDTKDRQIWYDSGQRSVVKMLISVYDEQSNISGS